MKPVVLTQEFRKAVEGFPWSPYGGTETDPTLFASPAYLTLEYLDGAYSASNALRGGLAVKTYAKIGDRSNVSRSSAPQNWDPTTVRYWNSMLDALDTCATLLGYSGRED